MRISSGELFDKIKTAFQKNMGEYVKYQDMLSTGKRINRPSDDPVGISKVIDYRVNIQNIEQYKNNINEVKEFLNFSENALGSAVDNLIRAKELAITAADDTITPEQRQYLAKEVAQIKEQILNIANAKFKDNYVFSGFKTDTAPFDTTNFNYLGDSGKIYVFLDKNIQISQNLPGNEIFGTGLGSVFKTLYDLQMGMENNDKALINNSLGMIDSDMNRILQAKADFGAKLNNVESMSSRQEETAFGLKELLSKVEDADITETIAELSKAQLALQALRQSSAPIIQQSLLDFLK